MFSWEKWKQLVLRPEAPEGNAASSCASTMSRVSKQQPWLLWNDFCSDTAPWS